MCHDHTVPQIPIGCVHKPTQTTFGKLSCLSINVYLHIFSWGSDEYKGSIKMYPMAHMYVPLQIYNSIAMAYMVVSNLRYYIILHGHVNLMGVKGGRRRGVGRGRRRRRDVEGAQGRRRGGEGRRERIQIYSAPFYVVRTGFFE